MTSTSTTTRDRVDALVDPVISEKRRARQQCAAQALSVILRRAERAGLPLITWKITPAGEVVGTLDTLDHGNSERRLSQAWGRWAKLLKLQAREPIRKSGGGTYFYAVNDNWLPRKDATSVPVTVAIIASTFEL